jgi:hypothetical protein
METTAGMHFSREASQGPRELDPPAALPPSPSAHAGRSLLATPAAAATAAAAAAAIIAAAEEPTKDCRSPPSDHQERTTVEDAARCKWRTVELTAPRMAGRAPRRARFNIFSPFTDICITALYRTVAEKTPKLEKKHRNSRSTK